MLPDKTQQELARKAFDLAQSNLKKATPSLRMLRLSEVKHRTGLGTSTIYLKMSRGEFPRQIPLGGGAAVGWAEHEIEAFLQQRIDVRDALASS
jgi:prophage regulatory protein